MRTKTLLIIAAVFLLGAVVAAAAVAKNMDNKTYPEDHECTPEMMEAGNMSENCPIDMMEDAPENHMADPDHCGNMGDDEGSMMGSNYKSAAL